MKYITKLIFLQIIIFFLANPSALAQQDKYSIDTRKVKTKHPIHISFKHLFHRSADQKAAHDQRKDDRKKRKMNKKYLKGKQKYWKKLDHPKEQGKNRRVYRRMKQNEKRAIKQQQGKNPDPLFKRIFKKKKRKLKKLKPSE